MSNPQGYKNDDVSINKLCQDIYDAFGAMGVIDFIGERQQSGYLKDVTWGDCDGCDWKTPRWGNSCLVCGTFYWTNCAGCDKGLKSGETVQVRFDYVHQTHIWKCMTCSGGRSQ
jgi:hypothetical protein